MFNSKITTDERKFWSSELLLLWYNIKVISEMVLNDEKLQTIP